MYPDEINQALSGLDEELAIKTNAVITHLLEAFREASRVPSSNPHVHFIERIENGIRVELSAGWLTNLDITVILSGLHGQADNGVYICEFEPCGEGESDWVVDIHFHENDDEAEACYLASIGESPEDDDECPFIGDGYSGADKDFLASCGIRT